MMRRLFAKVAEFRSLPWRLQQLTRRVELLQEQLDLVKFRSGVSDEMIRDFFEWKAAHPVPAQPLVSVCVATYNRAQLVTERCIASILKQTYGNLEVVVVGDGCTDRTAELIADMHDARIRFLNLPQRGKYPADRNLRWMVAGTFPMNTALEIASGDFITHLDDDDEFVPERVEKLLDFAVRHGCDFVWHPFWSERDNGAWVLNEAQEFQEGKVTTSSVFYRSWFKRIPWDINAYLLREPGDWNRFRRIKYIQPVARRYPEPLLRHYCQRKNA